jgi:hypothetical protein
MKTKALLSWERSETQFSCASFLRFDEQIANRPCKTHSSTASAAPAASYKSPYRKCAGGMLHRLTRRFRAAALVDRELRERFCNCYGPLPELTMSFRAALPACVAFVFAVAKPPTKESRPDSGRHRVLLGFVLLGQQEPMKHSG